MRRPTVAWLFLLLPALAAAQTSREYKSQGYVFGAPGVVSPGGLALLHFGAGASGLVYKGLGIGAEIGYMAPAREMREGFGILSANGSYSFTNIRTEKLVPFVTGGYSGAFRNGWFNLANFGGGVDYWFRERMGLKVEFRDHYWAQENAHALSFRVGLTFR